jgi:4-hydroxy-2-oxoheptanedioate aldolase
VGSGEEEVGEDLMNIVERKMVELLRDLKSNHHVVGVKAEFEAEGTRLEEALRLKEVLMKADLGLTLKIGGCEAVRDIYEARVIGVSRIVAPMVETEYALTKFLAALNLAIPDDERSDIDIAINVETAQACSRFPMMLAVPGIEKLNGIVIGRSDMCGSLGLDRDSINSEKVFEVTAPVIAAAKERGLEVAIGGGVSAQSLPMFRRLSPGHLDRYETRKVIFSCPGALADDAEAGILKALQFELYWLSNKRDFYGLIHREDEARIRTLETRYRRTMDAMGIKP